MSNRQATVQFVQTVPVRLTVDIRSVRPRHPVLSEEPLVKVRGIIDLSPDPTEKELPLWFDAEVQLYADAVPEVLSFSPTYGAIQGIKAASLLGIYEHTFAMALLNSDLRILGVRR